MATWVQIMGEAVRISHSANNTLWKGMNPTILPLAMDKVEEQTEHFSLGLATSLGEGQFWIQTT